MPVFSMVGHSAFGVPKMRDMRSPRALLMDADTRDAVFSNEAPRVPWNVFIDRFNWAQGEHVALIGPTGRGKTSLLLRILELRDYVIVAATKPADATMDYLISHGYRRMDRWETLPSGKVPKRVIWPDARDIKSATIQHDVFSKMYERVYREGGWTLVIDEGYVMSEMLKLKPEMRTIWTQGRSIGISHVVATQRPRWVPNEMYDQSSHLFFWQNSDRRMLDVIGDIAGRDKALVMELVANLEVNRYQVLYINGVTGEMMRTVPPAPNFDTTR